MEYKSAEEYIVTIQNEIKWKRAKYVATREIADHISDQSEAYCKDGLSGQDALCRTLLELGDAKSIGIELNRLHRPKTNWLLLAVTVSFLAIGTSIDLVFANVSFTRNILAVVLGLSIMALLYFADYTLLIRYPRISFFVLLSLTTLALFYDARNGLSLVGYSYSFYFLLLFSLIQICVAYYIKSSGSSIGLLQLLLYLTPPLIISALLASPPVLIYLVVVDSALVIYVLAKRWYAITRNEIVGIVCLLTILVLGLVYANMLTNMWGIFFNTGGNYISESTRQAISHLPFWGSSSLSTEIYNDKPEYTLVRLAFEYGQAVFIMAGILFVTFFILLIRVIQKQTSYFARNISFAVLLVLSMQFISSFLGNAGVINGIYTMPFPLVASGGLFTIFNLSLIGIMMSISRNESIVKDWLKYKDKKVK